MKTNYFLKSNSSHQNTVSFDHSSKQNLKQQNSNSILQDDALEDDFTDGDFTKNLIIATLNNWSRQHFQTEQFQAITLDTPLVNYKN